MNVEVEVVCQYCTQLKMPTVKSQFERLAEEARKKKTGHIAYLEELFSAELDDREARAIRRRLREACLPRMKTLEDFDFEAGSVSAGEIRDLAEGEYIRKAEPVIFIGDCGTGKTHLMTALCVSAVRKKFRVRFATAAGLVNELVEARNENRLSRVLKKWRRYDVVAIDELGYVPLADVGAELLFQVISERAEKASVMLTTNLPFKEWVQVFQNARLCKAILDRVTDRAHIVETGTESYRFRRSRRRGKQQ